VTSVGYSKQDVLPVSSIAKASVSADAVFD
jgi:hypothetical protein